MGGFARAALSAAILALACICVLGAQGEVTLESANAVKSGQSLAIDLRTSEPATFKLDRFTGGDWVFAWSPTLSAPEIEQLLDCDLSAGGGMVSKLALSRDGKHNGVRIYLGLGADRHDVFLVSTKDGTRIFVPPVRPRVGNPIGTLAAGGQPGSGTVPVADFSGGAGILDYQLTPQMPPTGSGGSSGDDEGSNTDSGTDAGESLLPQPSSVPDRSSKPAPTRPRFTPSSSGIGTPDGIVESAFAEAKISFGELSGSPSNGKEALDNVLIDLFEIVNEPLDSALQLLVNPTDFSIIVDASVGDNVVSLSFKNGQTSLRQALDLLSRTYSLEYVVEAGTIVIASQDKIYTSLIKPETRLFVLSYADPQSIRNMLITTGVVAETQIEYYMGELEYPTVNGSTMLSSTGEDDADIALMESNGSTTPRNALLVRGTPDLLTYVAQVIGQLDRKPMQIQLEVRVCELNDMAIKNLGVQVDQTITQSFQEIGSQAGDDDSFPFTEFGANQLGSLNRTGGLNFSATLNAQITNG
ncbi:MAG: hypothetical protein M3R04_06610, partial [bacterium]|nr:hypothetical protein [bacterium]